MSKKLQTFHDYMQSRMTASSPKKINKRGKMAKGDYETGLFGGGKSPAQQAAEQAAAQRTAQRAAEQAQRQADAQANQRAAQARAAQQTTPQAPSGSNGAAQAAQAGATKPVYSAPTGNGAAAAAQLGATTDPEARRKANALRDARQRAATQAAAAKAAAAQRAGGNMQGGGGVGQWINDSVSNVLRNFATTANAQEVENPIVTPVPPPPPPPPDGSTTPETVTVAPKTITPVTPNPEITPETPSPIVPGEGGKTTPVPSSLMDFNAFNNWIQNKGSNAQAIWNNLFGTSDKLDFPTTDEKGNPIYRNSQGQPILTPGAKGFNSSYVGSLETYTDPITGEVKYINKEVPDPRAPSPFPMPVLADTAIPAVPPDGYGYTQSQSIAESILNLGNVQSKRVAGSLVPYNINPLGLSTSTFEALVRAKKGNSVLTDEQVVEIKGKIDAAAQKSFVENNIGVARADYNLARQTFAENISELTKNPIDNKYLYQNPVFNAYINNSANRPTASKLISDIGTQAGNVVANNMLGTAIANANNLVGTQTADGPTKINPPLTPQPTLTPRPTMDPSLLTNPTAAAAASQTAAAGGGGGGGNTKDQPRSGGGNGNTTITGNGSATAASAPFTRAGVAPDANGFYPVPPDRVGYPDEQYWRTGSHGLGTKNNPMQIYPDQPPISDFVRDDWAKNGGFYARNPQVTVVSNVATPTRTPYNPAMGQGLTGPARLQREAQATETANALRQTAQATESGIFRASMTPTATQTPAPTQMQNPESSPQPQVFQGMPNRYPESNFFARYGLNPDGSVKTNQPSGTGPNRVATPTKTTSLNVAQDEIAQILNNQRTMQQQAASAFPQFASTGPTKQARMSPSKKTKKLKKDIGVGTGLTAHATQPVPESPMPKIRTTYGSYKFKKPQQQRSAKYGEDQQLNQPIRKQINPVQPRQTMQNVMQFPPSDAFQPFAKMIGNPMDKYEKNDLTKSLQQTSKFNNAYSNEKYKK